MNYRHAFHAGNFADLVKHAALLAVLETLHARGPITVIDSHAGAGLYDLAGDMAQRSGEGVAARRLMANPETPAVFASLKAAIARANAGADGTLYPGSPLLVAQSLRAGDRLIACELRPDELSELRQRLAPFSQAQVIGEDGYEILAGHTPATGPLLVLIDPPFERPDDYQRAAQAAGAVLSRNAGATVVIWLPLKDLETLDAFVRRLRDASDAPLLVAQARLKALSDPMRMNGCALAVLNPPAGLEPKLQEICAWVVGELGDAAARAVVERIALEA